MNYGQFHQNYMDTQNSGHGYGGGQGGSHPSSSPQMLNNMNQNSMMSHHGHPGSMSQFQQMNAHTGQHSYFMPQNN